MKNYPMYNELKFLSMSSTPHSKRRPVIHFGIMWRTFINMTPISTFGPKKRSPNTYGNERVHAFKKISEQLDYRFSNHSLIKTFVQRTRTRKKKLTGKILTIYYMNNFLSLW